MVCFSPLTGISLAESNYQSGLNIQLVSFSPLTGISLAESHLKHGLEEDSRSDFGKGDPKSPFQTSGNCQLKLMKRCNY